MATVTKQLADSNHHNVKKDSFRPASSFLLGEFLLSSPECLAVTSVLRGVVCYTGRATGLQGIECVVLLACPSLAVIGRVNAAWERASLPCGIIVGTGEDTKSSKLNRAAACNL